MKLLLILATFFSLAAHAESDPPWGVDACTEYTKVLTWLDQDPATLEMDETMILGFVEAKDCKDLGPKAIQADCFQKIREAFKLGCAGFQGVTGSPSNNR